MHANIYFGKLVLQNFKIAYSGKYVGKFFFLFSKLGPPIVLAHNFKNMFHQ